uniref:Uncharacterized protein n=1 Tax=Trichuris muris TaxID=70415 RepID=A0A5S6QWR5_TRIMR
MAKSGFYVKHHSCRRRTSSSQPDGSVEDSSTGDPDDRATSASSEQVPPTHPVGDFAWAINRPSSLLEPVVLLSCMPAAILGRFTSGPKTWFLPSDGHAFRQARHLQPRCSPGSSQTPHVTGSYEWRWRAEQGARRRAAVPERSRASRRPGNVPRGRGRRRPQSDPVPPTSQLATAAVCRRHKFRYFRRLDTCGGDRIRKWGSSKTLQQRVAARAGKVWDLSLAT